MSLDATNLATFRQQLMLFSQVLQKVRSEREALPCTERPSPKRLLAFVEALLVCPDEAAVQSHIERDLEAAEWFRIRAGDVGRASDAKSALSAEARTTPETPFYLLAATLLRNAQLSDANLGDDWKPLPPK